MRQCRRMVLRGKLPTNSEPRYIRTDLSGRSGEDHARKLAEERAPICAVRDERFYRPRAHVDPAILDRVQRGIELRMK